MDQEKLDQKVEELDLADHSPSEIRKEAQGLRSASYTLRRERKDVRYRLYRVRTEDTGGPSSEVDEEFKQKFESQEEFGGWKNFSITWDVKLDDPWICIHRDKSQAEEWEDVVNAKFPMLNPDGSVTYPDPKVKKAVEAEGKKQKKARKKRG